MAAGRLPAPARFREVEGRGLLVRAWVNGSGAYTFAIDTGAGATIISRRVAAEARVGMLAGRAINLSGLSGAGGAAGREARLESLAVGEPGNYVPARGLFIVADSLPPDLDGVLDPTESFWPLGYTLDLPNGELIAFDPRVTPLRAAAPPGGATVSWLNEAGSRRPFVRLDSGQRALIDTGSGLGLALSGQAAQSLGLISGAGRAREGGLRDLGRGRVDARRVEPATVRIGALVLRRVPTDLLTGAAADAPVLLGRDALSPFRIAFDPLNRLIRFTPSRR